jgi:hypothetical protein
MLKDRFEYLVDRLYRAGLRNNVAESNMSEHKLFCGLLYGIKQLEMNIRK